MKLYGYFNQRFTAQTVTSIYRGNWSSVWGIPNICGISTGMTFILGSSTQVEPPDYELNMPESSRGTCYIKDKPPGSEDPEGLGVC